MLPHRLWSTLWLTSRVDVSVAVSSDAVVLHWRATRRVTLPSLGSSSESGTRSEY